MAEHKISEVLAKPDAALEMTLRPSLFSEFTGQLKVKERLEITVAAAKQRKEAIDHILFSGPPGLGKTTLAYILAKAMGANLKSTSGPTIEKAGDLAGLLTNLEEGDVLFIDEIHRLQKTIEEYLYPAMEDFKLDIIIDQGPNARSVRLNLPRFTLIGATTRSGLLTAPLLTRFPIRERLDYYQADQLQQIVVRSARLLNVETEEKGRAGNRPPQPRHPAHRQQPAPPRARLRPGAARGPHHCGRRRQSPRHARDRRERPRRNGQAHPGDRDRQVRRRPGRLSSIAVAVGEEPDTLEEVYEPYLIMEGYLKRTPQGRVATELLHGVVDTEMVLGYPTSDALETSTGPLRAVLTRVRESRNPKHAEMNSNPKMTQAMADP
jgi:Holliday junction DNA helicase RuvB